MCLEVFVSTLVRETGTRVTDGGSHNLIHIREVVGTSNKIWTFLTLCVYILYTFISVEIKTLSR
jgi:hypothetical protein